MRTRLEPVPGALRPPTDCAWLPRRCLIDLWLVPKTWKCDSWAGQLTGWKEQSVWDRFEKFGSPTIDSIKLDVKLISQHPKRVGSEEQILNLLLQLGVALAQPLILEAQERHRLTQMPWQSCDQNWQNWHDATLTELVHGTVHTKTPRQSFFRRQSMEVLWTSHVVAAMLQKAGVRAHQNGHAGSSDTEQKAFPCQHSVPGDWSRQGLLV